VNLILFGFKSCGKTTLGKIIAQRLNRPLLDTDRLVERLHFNHTGKGLSFREIFKAVGEEGFRALESDVLQQLKGVRNTVIALGGGLILNPENAAFLAKLGLLVYLKLSKQTLKDRILNQDLPAYLDRSDPQGSFEHIYQERRAKYEKIFALSVDLETKKQDQVVLEICALIQKLEIEHG
jgi:shikimate kinase